MFNYLETIRSKPDGMRKRYAFGVSVVIVMLIGGVWGTLQINAMRENSKNAVVAKSEPSPFGAMVDNISAGYREVAESISESNPFNAGVNSATAAESFSDDFVEESEYEVASTSPTVPSDSETVSFDEVIITDSPSN